MGELLRVFSLKRQAMMISDALIDDVKFGTRLSWSLVGLGLWRLCCRAEGWAYRGSGLPALADKTCHLPETQEKRRMCVCFWSLTH